MVSPKSLPLLNCKLDVHDTFHRCYNTTNKTKDIFFVNAASGVYEAIPKLKPTLINSSYDNFKYVFVMFFSSSSSLYSFNENFVNLSRYNSMKIVLYCVV